MVPRSWLFVPGDSPRKIEKALNSSADALIFDWEDAVSQANKATGRSTTNEALEVAGCAVERIWIRINGLNTRWFADDLAALPLDRIAGVVLPKCCGPADVARLDQALTQCESGSDGPVGRLKVVAIVTETAASVLALPEFRGPLPRLSAMLWGGEDLAADLGARANLDSGGRYRTPFQHARTMALYAAAAAECQAIDAVDVDFRNLQNLERECADARADGFVAKAAVHPSQVGAINLAFSATAEELAWARRVVDALPDGGVAVVDGQMVDMPHLRIARRILAR